MLKKFIEEKIESQISPFLTYEYICCPVKLSLEFGFDMITESAEFAPNITVKGKIFAENFKNFEELIPS